MTQIDEDLTLSGLTFGCPKAKPDGEVNSGGDVSSQDPGQVDIGGDVSSQDAGQVESGSNVSTEPAQSAVSGGSVATIPEDDPYAPKPLNYGRIGWDSKLRGSSTSSGDPAGLTLTYSTYERVEDTASIIITYTLSASTNFDFVGVAGLQPGSLVIVRVGGTEVYNGSPGDVTLYVNFDTISASTVEVVSSVDVDTGLSSIAVVFAGEELVMMRPHYSGVNPLSKSNNTTYSPQMSESGNFLGRQIIRNGASQNADYRNLDNDWYNSEFYPFVKHARRFPYFYAWNLEEDPNGSGYGWTNSDIIPTKQGTRDLLQVSWPIEFYR